MELHERLVTTKPAVAPPTKEPFADLKNSIHMLVISELGPQLTGQVIDPIGMRERVDALSGTFSAGPEDNERWAMRASLPLHATPDTLAP